MCYECLPVVKLQLYRDVSVFIILSDGGDPEVQVNAAELTEAPNQSSEEPKAVLASDYQ